MEVSLPNAAVFFSMTYLFDRNRGDAAACKVALRAAVSAESCQRQRNCTNRAL